MTPFEPSPEDADIEEILQRPEATIIIHSCHKTAAWIEPHTTSSPALSARREMWPSTGPQGSSQPPRATTPRARARPLPRPRARGALPRGGCRCAECVWPPPCARARGLQLLSNLCSSGLTAPARSLHSSSSSADPDDHRRPADILLVETSTCIDFVLTHPAAPSLCKMAATKSRAAADRRAKDNVQLYDSYRKRHGYRFQPFGMETFGALTKGA
eukprot:CAMPEP_0174899210 /NCGR_PEP_ID=MMETSP0167-20121228/25959_1 /TAXON_ID=38298 /ORGANISM="Rhodella maculata, Strain CCMP736" /LENGTH=214 /DNA_ID=CAMNT_0016140123 /DNA_START=381 /DNA_END=1023 /DNA_ORIENTATION=-